jgi:phosphoserine phosphatase RsbU/P
MVKTAWTERLLLALAILFALAMLLHAGTWMYYVRWSFGQAPVELGFDSNYDNSRHGLHVSGVWANSPAQAAGLKPGDAIVAINALPLGTSTRVQDEVWLAGHPGQEVDLTVLRPGSAVPVQIRGYFRARTARQGNELRNAAQELSNSFPVLFLVVAIPVLFMRVHDRNAWLLTLLFACFVAVPDLPGSLEFAPKLLREFCSVYRAIFDTAIGPMFYWFFAVFPQRSPIDRRVPWLKWVLILAVPFFAVPALHTGNPGAPPFLIRLIGESSARTLRLCYAYGSLLLGLASVVANGSANVSPDARRKLRVLLWGTVVGIGPVLLVRMLVDFTGWDVPFGIDVSSVIIAFLFPLSFGYAVVKHRVLEIPVLLQRSARYVFVRRGFLVLVFLLAGVADGLFAVSFAHLHLQPLTATSIGVGFGIVLAWVSSPGLKRATEGIDRHFFRGAYDVRVILQELAENIRSTAGREQLASMLEQQLTRALHPSFVSVYLRTGEKLVRQDSTQDDHHELPANIPELCELARQNFPQEAPPDDERPSLWSMLHANCLVPLLGRDAHLLGLIVLGLRLSEEAYSSEDEDLLRSVANQASVALENIGLAEQMAERLDAERRVQQEMQIAREVQKKLLPQQAPVLQTLDYAGECLQARAVGGDYYDFLDLGSGRVGFVLADVAGKGISAALLMANLQANLRSQYATALEDPVRLLRGVNQVFYNNTADNRYATLFFARYDDSDRTLFYVNCGHNPPVLLRKDGTIERLSSTATVLGLFSDWNCEVQNVQLRPGDTLIAFTDGVTEATNPHGEEFGEERLIEFMRKFDGLSTERLLRRIQESVLEFSPGEQHDDLTLLVIRGK